MPKKNNTKRRRKLLLLSILFTSILLITTTYAWFTANRVVSIDALNVHVQADGGLEVSTDAINWKQVITNDDIKDASKTYPGSENQVPYQLFPTSTGGNVSNGKLEMFKGEATNTSGTNYVLVANRSIETNSFGEESDGSFIVFDIFFKTSNQKDLYLSSNSKITYLGDQSVGIENATRVAFLNEGTSGDNSNIAQNLNNASNAIIWEPNYDVHTTYGVQNALNVYGLHTSTSGAAALPYYGVINDIAARDNVSITEANSNRYPNFFKSVNPNIKTVMNNTNNEQILTLNSGITKLRIYMWIEGQDVDCEDNASYGDISFSLEFTTNPA